MPGLVVFGFPQFKNENGKTKMLKGKSSVGFFCYNYMWFISGTCIGTLRGHEDEVLDVAFDMTGQFLLTASADGTARCYNAVTHSLVSKFEGHEGEISKVSSVVCVCVCVCIGRLIYNCCSLMLLVESKLKNIYVYE